MNKKKQIFIHFLFLLVFLPFVNSIYSQNLTRIKSIKKFEGDSLIHYRLFDTSGNLIFVKYYEEFNRWAASVMYYNSEKNIVKDITGHTALGYMIWDYNYDSAGNEVASYDYEELYDYKQTRVSHGYIRNYSTAKDLESDSFVLNMNVLQRRHKFSGKVYDIHGNKLTDTLFEDDGSVHEITFYKYDNEGHLVEISYNNSSDKFYEIYDWKNRKSISLKINEKGDTTEVHKYKYNIHNQKIADSSFSKGKLDYCYKMFYKENKLVKKLFFKPSDISTKDRYQYNARGNIIRQTTKDYWDKSKKIYTWKYEFY